MLNVNFEILKNTVLKKMKNKTRGNLKASTSTSWFSEMISKLKVKIY